MGLRCMMSVFLYVCAFLTRKCSSQNSASVEPEQGSQICNVFLVSGKYGVPDEYLSASSIYDAEHAAKYGRLNTTFVDGYHIGAWAARHKSANEHIEVELNQLSLIRAIVTQGRNGTGDKRRSNQFVKAFKVSYSMDRIEWRFINNTNGSEMLFPGNTDQNSIQINDIQCPFEAQYIRIHPWDYHNHPSMRFDIIGCLLTEENSTTDCGFENGLCGWMQEPKIGLLYWKREIPSIKRESSDFCAVNCTLLALAPTYGTNLNMALRPGNLIRYIPRSSMSRCLRVWSTTTTTDGAYLNLTIVGCAAHAAVDRSVTGILNEDEWTPVEVDVRSSDYHLIITGGWEFGRKGYLAIDNISMTNGYCPNCDFKDDLCNWNNTGSVSWNLRREVVSDSHFPTDKHGSHRTKANNIQMYTGVGVGFVLVLITLAIIMVYVLRWRKGTTNTNMEEIRPDNIENAKNVAKVEYAVLIKTSVTRSAKKLEMDSDAIYENECKPGFVLSTENVDQMYDHVPTDEKLPNLMDETYNHATLVQKLDNEEYQNVSSVLPNPTKIDTEDGHAEDTVTYSNVTVGFKFST